jgi:tight adherence protein B
MGVLGAFIGFFAPRIFVARVTAQRLVRFENQLPDTLGLWVNALRSGYSVLQSMEAISRDAPEPTSTEFKRVVQEVQLGIDMEDALEHLLNRLDSEDLDLVVTAVNIQREVGGNLAEILDVISHTIRERIKLKGEIRVLTAQGRITGYLISGLPIILALFLYVINPGYMGNLFENQMCGWPLLGCGLSLIGIGFALIQKIVDIDI